MKKYKEAPWWWYAILLVLSFVAGDDLSHHCQPNYSYVTYRACGRTDRRNDAPVVVLHHRSDLGHLHHRRPEHKFEMTSF